MPLSPAGVCQASLVAISAGILVLTVVPKHLRTALMAYGARRDHDAASNTAKKQADAGQGGKTETRHNASHLLRPWTLTVPHSWFLSYYVLSVTSSAFWAWQFWRRGSLMTAMAQAQVRLEPQAMHHYQQLPHVILAWAMLSIQGCRRLYECLFVSKLGSSPMLVLHWLLGLAFYSLAGVSVWIQGSGAILEPWQSSSPNALLTWRVPLALALFAAATLKQNECHGHLASLKKYTLPNKGLFSRLVCPHYTCECVIYLAIALMAAPAGALFNRCVLSCLLFTIVNLGLTAHDTKQWYAQKFGAQQVANKWIMIPFVF
ncbi:hypothetical protein CDD82_1816 [Ophiocordyceps australis]|uniref:Polyprenal reductase n=1 Tax=Ophiocordyceps australis TaxID=1399860 RepID=A0A2C5ZLR1_9HYPO|nr:hypothetical protein CDD82_1816 [Ophiocordyceps australis]